MKVVHAVQFSNHYTLYYNNYKLTAYNGRSFWVCVVQQISVTVCHNMHYYCILCKYFISKWLQSSPTVPGGHMHLPLSVSHDPPFVQAGLHAITMCTASTELWYVWNCKVYVHRL